MRTVLSKRKNAHAPHGTMAGLFDKLAHHTEKSWDWGLLSITLSITLMGLVMVFSASGVMADKNFSESTHFLQRQALWLVMGLLVMAAIASMDYTVWRLHAPKILLFSLLLLLLVLVWGSTVNGARRWLSVGWMAIQPTELAKLAVVLYLARYLSKEQACLTEWKRGLLPPLVIVSLVAGLVLAEPDYGNAIVLCLLLFGMLYLAGAKIRHLLVLSVPIMLGFLGLLYASPERWERMTTFWDPWKDARGGGYQLVQSFAALGNGGLFGVGLGQGKQKLLYLPEGHTDFVLALIGEELGFAGTVTLLTLFAILIGKGFRIAHRAHDPFGRNLAQGIALLLGIEVLINSGVVSGLLPTKGLTLPLVSYGGSSLLTSLAAMGMLISVARRYSP